MRSVKETLKRSHPWSTYISQTGKADRIPLQKVVLIAVNYRMLCGKKLYLFTLLYQMRRNYKLGQIDKLEQLIVRPYVNKQQPSKQAHLLFIYIPNK